MFAHLRFRLFKLGRKNQFLLRSDGYTRSLSQNKMEVISFLKKLTKKSSPNIGCFWQFKLTQSLKIRKTAVWEIKKMISCKVSVSAATPNGTELQSKFAGSY